MSSKKRHTVIFFVIAILLSGSLFGQERIKVDPIANENIENFILEKFVKPDDCIEVTNVQVIGEATSIGSFSNGSDAIGVEEGIVFTTGNLVDITGPNFSQGQSGQSSGLSDEPYLRRISMNRPVFDAVGIEFDFTSTFSFVSFTYIFASEEYCEFVGSEFNDVFGFFVTGPGIVGDGFDNSLNIAKIPEKNDVVAINSVNHLSNQQFYIDNITVTDGQNCNIEPNPRSLQLIEFDGFTVRLQAFVKVEPCETYKLRMVVGDVSDADFDSAVFFESNSLTTTGLARVEAQVFESDSIVVYEDCLEGQFAVIRNKFANIDEEINVTYTITGTAESGVDFEVFSGEIVIPAREREVYLPLEVIPDNIDEIAETVKITIETISCDCVRKDTALLIIEDSKTNIDLFLDDPLVCAGQEFTLSPEIDDPIEPISYLWDNGDTTSGITDQIFNPKTYKVTVSDACGATDSLTINASLQEVPEILLGGVYGWCDGKEPNSIDITFVGQPPWTLQYSVNDGNFITLNNINSNPYPFPLRETGVYKFRGFNDRYCSGIVRGDSVIVEALGFEVEHEASAPSCRNAKDGSIQLNISNGIPPYQVLWNVDGENQSTITGLAKGEYSVTVTDDFGCQVTRDITVPRALIDSECDIDLESSIYIPNVFSPNEDGFNDQFTVFPDFTLIRSVSFQLFDRWGNKVFQSGSINNDGRMSFWDGGRYMEGVYSCLVDIMLSNGSMRSLATEVVLVR